MLLELLMQPHIPIQRPRTQFHQRYINCKGCHGIILTAIVDDTESFTYIYSGQPGSVHDAHAFKQSDFWEEVMEVRFYKSNIILYQCVFILLQNFRKRVSQ